MNILLADCGSTKCDWALVNRESGALLQSFRTDGLNLAIADPAAIRGFVETLPAISGVGIIEFYGAGAKINPLNDTALSDAFSGRFGCGTHIDTDLVGAAKALFGKEAGIACILGTGSNSGFYDGETIEANTPPLGFILGDEGSGASLGKRLVNAIFKGLLPSGLTDAFFAEYPITKQELIERVYRQPGGNFFLARLAPFLSANIGREEISSMVEDEFRTFFSRNLLQYDRFGLLPIGFVGSVACHFREQLCKVAKEYLPGLDVEAVRFLPSPITGLILHAAE